VLLLVVGVAVNQFFGYSYVCTCGQMISTEGGLDYEDQLEFIQKVVGKHRTGHWNNTLGFALSVDNDG